MSEAQIDELIRDYLDECLEQLAAIEIDLLAIEAAGAAVDQRLVNRVFRAAHSIKGGAGLFDLFKIRQLAHKAENTLDSIRSGELVPTSDVVTVLLRAFDLLRDLLRNHNQSNAADITGALAALAALPPVPVE
jgi:two-component system chemotaxis sensor kinase CheA